MRNRWTCGRCQHQWASDSLAAYWCPSCGAPKVLAMPLFVALEGIDASGKAVQSRRLAHELGAELFSFPDYRTPIGKLIDAHLKGEWKAIRLGSFGPDNSDIGYPAEPLIFQALQSANRLELAPNISKALSEGKPVVADRYYGSGLVYGTADGLDLEYLERLHRFLPQPTHWILLDIEPEISAERRPERRDRYEKDAEFMQQVCLLYRQIWIRNGWPVVDGRGSVDDVTEQIRRAISV